MRSARAGFSPLKPRPFTTNQSLKLLLTIGQVFAMGLTHALLCLTIDWHPKGTLKQADQLHHLPHQQWRQRMIGKMPTTYNREEDHEFFDTDRQAAPAVHFGFS